MSKTIFSTVLLMSLACSALAQSLDSLSFNCINNTPINLSVFRSKKIIVITFDAANPDTVQLKAFDSLYRSAGNIVVIGIPVSDYDSSTVNIASLYSWLINNGISYPVSVVSKGKKGAGQHSLMQWITTVSNKNHYNIDMTAANELFMISNRGVLYAVFSDRPPLSNAFVQAALNKNPVR